jgi:hypothetical protein
LLISYKLVNTLNQYLEPTVRPAIIKRGSGNYVQGEYVMQIAEFEITGIGSILMRNPAGMQVCTKYERGGKTIPEPVDEARRSLYANPSTGQLYIKSDCFREAALIAAADVRDPTRKGRATMTRRFSAGTLMKTGRLIFGESLFKKMELSERDQKSVIGSAIYFLNMMNRLSNLN